MNRTEPLILTVFLKNLKTVGYGRVRYGDGEGTIWCRKRSKFVRNTEVFDHEPYGTKMGTVIRLLLETANRTKIGAVRIAVPQQNLFGL